MIHEKIRMTTKGSFGTPTLELYLISPSDSLKIRKRPLVIVCPGGAYEFVSEREGEMLALSFNAMGYHAAVLTYSVAPAVYPVQLMELAKSVLYVRERAEEWCIDRDRIFVQGSSAGGHLAASFGCFWNRDIFNELTGGCPQKLRPNGIILSYPVITSGEYAHRDSFKNLLGSRYGELVEEMSLEKQVSEAVPPVFIWHTYEDELVPVENSLLFMEALRKKGVMFEGHIYPKGGHGLSLGNELTCSPQWNEIQPEVSEWITMAGRFISMKL